MSDWRSDVCSSDLTKYTEVRARAPKRWTEAELADFYRHYATEAVRGAETRFWEDVQVGDALPTMAKGPMTVTGFIAYAQGWGGIYIRANTLAWKQIDSPPVLCIENRFRSDAVRVGKGSDWKCRVRWASEN